jgi:RNA polymerase I-specific transcription initiation factor RRN3
MNSTIKSAIHFLMNWITIYCENFAPKYEMTLPIFYATVQAVAYIICFKGERILGNADGLEFLQQWNWDTLIFSNDLDPLRYCLYTIRIEFIKVIKRMDLIPKLSVKPNKYLTGSLGDYESGDEDTMCGASGAGGATSSDNPLDSFFPFDPYLLRRSSRYINNIYVRWTGHAGRSELDEDEWYDDGAKVESPLVTSMATSMSAMSITPIGSLVRGDDFHQLVMGSLESHVGSQENIMSQNLSKFTSIHGEDSSW